MGVLPPQVPVSAKCWQGPIQVLAAAAPALSSSVTALSTAGQGQLGLPRGAFPVLDHGLGLGAISTEFHREWQGRGALGVVPA